MMGQLNRNQGQLFYSFCLDEAVPDDHLAREIAGEQPFVSCFQRDDVLA